MHKRGDDRRNTDASKIHVTTIECSGLLLWSKYLVMLIRRTGAIESYCISTHMSMKIKIAIVDIDNH